RRRSAAQCQGGGGYERERFRPCATRDLEKEKRRLQNLLATGCEEPPPPPLPAPPAPPTERDRFQEVLDEIEERRSFLEEMTSLGRGKEYQPIISTEISQKIRELEMIDKVRSSKLTEEREREMARGRKDQQQQ
ncbi:EVG1 protein, partial [Amia calva]|nr:EVG1 protein [Amia calva]